MSIPATVNANAIIAALAIEAALQRRIDATHREAIAAVGVEPDLDNGDDATWNAWCARLDDEQQARGITALYDRLDAATLDVVAAFAAAVGPLADVNDETRAAVAACRDIAANPTLLGLRRIVVDAARRLAARAA